jgi:2-dehydro-3-deoxyphosphooctonate aldolase (KDO 8-P synthase)
MTPARSVRAGAVAIGGGRPLMLIAGPCVIESEELVFRTAATLKQITARLGLPFIFKSSYDKANRSSVDGFRGPGLERGLQILERVRREFEVPVLSDIHDAGQAAVAAEVLDVIQIPAFLCRQTDILIAAGRTGKAVNLKKGQFMAPEDMAEAARKVEAAGNPNVFLTERGSSFGYHNLVVDMRSLAIMRGLGYPAVFDATHSVQLPSGQGGSSGGDRRFIPVLARAAVAAGIDGLFLEVHPDPDRALCDGPNSWPLAELEPLLLTLLALDRAARGERE